VIPVHPGLTEIIAPADSVWSTGQKRKWLQTAANIFDMIYPDQELTGSWKINSCSRSIYEQVEAAEDSRSQRARRKAT
jgi:hypothetical protein